MRRHTQISIRSKSILWTLIFGIISSGLFLKSCKPQETKFEAPLFENMGSYTLDIMAESKFASQFVTQGVIMANAFNHGEAARSFREAIRIDSTCAMAYWGLAYVLGPNYNTNSDQGEKSEITSAVQKAIKYSEGASEWEKELIRVLSLKFPQNSETDEEAYASGMETAYEKFPDNDFVVTLYAESLMNLHAWDLYTRKGGEAKSWTPEIVNLIEQAIALNPNNPLANHLYIHATEAAPDVEKSIPSAERLSSLVPGAGHLVHMPSHAYINTGDYHLASEANEQAVKVDSIYIAECLVKGVYPQLYYPHNWHFLAATAALEGRATRSIEAAFKTAEIIDRNYLREEGFSTTQHYITIPVHVLIKFSQWEKILATPKPDDDLVYPLSIWHYARGMAFANTGLREEANEELLALEGIIDQGTLKDLMIWEINSAEDIANIARHVLRGEIAKLSGNMELAVEHFQEGIEIEDQLNYNEPPDWFFSVRHFLGDVYLEMGLAKEAESVYREDLSYWVKNGFALSGLYHSLILQERTDEAKEVLSQFEEAWQYADVELKYSRLDELKRENLVIHLDQNTALDLVYIAGSFCNSN